MVRPHGFFRGLGRGEGKKEALDVGITSVTSDLINLPPFFVIELMMGLILVLKGDEQSRGFVGRGTVDRDEVQNFDLDPDGEG